jgi:protein-disulfide isomerase
MRRYLPFVIIGIVLLVGSVSALLLYRSKQASTPLKLAEGKPGAEPPHVRGPANARATLEEFGDFQCPPCGTLAATLLKIEHDYADRVRVVYRQFPLAMHAHAFTAACAAEAAGLQGRFWEMHDLLFLNAPEWSKESPKPFITVLPNGSSSTPVPESATGIRLVFSNYATTLGLDVERFQRDLNSEQVIRRVKADQERGDSVGVNRTPILFIDGVQIPYSQFAEKELREVIDAALNGKPPAPLASPSPTPEPQPR